MNVMEMREVQPGAYWLAFGGYTLLGYLALGIHGWIFAPGLEGNGSAGQVALVMLNLLAGSWCFLNALRVVRAVTH
ncbi:MAG: hypothetical protein ACREIA_17230 [Opitutaceae bacterium]